ncbi:MAG: hypothetical protein Q4G63_00400 [Bacteroidia bacterium]|nr:hypothetical protein [Bacteroidia bacterium]
MKKYKIFVSRKEWAFIIVLMVLIVFLVLWFYVGKEREPWVLLFQLPWMVLIFLIQAKEVRLYDNDTLELRQYIRNKAFKPISVQQISSFKRDSKNKNKLILIYHRDQLRGDWTIRLSEKDIDALISELTRRNPAIVEL